MLDDPKTYVGEEHPRSGLCAQARVCASAKHGADSPDPEFAPCVEHRDIGRVDGFGPLIVLVKECQKVLCTCLLVWVGSSALYTDTMGFIVGG